MAASSDASARGRKPSSDPDRMTILPHPVLEIILVTNTSTEDKKALRQTCKLFRQTLDGSMVVANLRLNQHVERKSLISFLRRLKHAQGITIHEHSNNSITQSLLVELPDQLTTLSLHQGVTNLEDLGRLTCLKSLTLGPMMGVTGLEHITGLTRLEYCKPVGSLAYLAPTLKHLYALRVYDIIDLDRLTNLETLKLFDNLPTDFFRRYGQIPLKCICLKLYLSDAWSEEMWESAPPTLNTMILYGEPHFSQLSDFSSQITQLQLLEQKDCGLYAFCMALKYCTTIRELKRLVVSCTVRSDLKYFRNISKMANLEALGLCVYNKSSQTHYDYEAVVSEVPEIASRTASGVRVMVVQDTHELQDAGFDSHFRSHSKRWSLKSAWVTRY